MGVLISIKHFWLQRGSIKSCETSNCEDCFHSYSDEELGNSTTKTSTIFNEVYMIQPRL